jgi:hypothetical protein
MALFELYLPPALSDAWAWLPCREIMEFCCLGQWGERGSGREIVMFAVGAGWQHLA